MKAIEKIREVTEILQNSGFESPDREAELLISRALDISTLNIYTDNPDLDKDSMRTFEDMLKRRLTREPSQYISGYEEFMGLKLAVGPGVLIPRPETELMAEMAIKTAKSYELRVKSERQNSKLQTPIPTRSPREAGHLPGRQAGSSLVPRSPRAKPTGPSSLSILDLCSGSGCLALSLAKEFPDAMVFGTDISETALAYAKRNAEINGINNVTFLQGDLFEQVESLLSSHHQSDVAGFYSSPSTMPNKLALHHAKQTGPPNNRRAGRQEQTGGQAGKQARTNRRAGASRSLFDLIISNPPYIKTGEIKGLQPEIRDWEPLTAFDGGEDGLDHYRNIIPAARKFLKDKGMIMLEIGQGQADDITEIMSIAGYEHINVIKDYAGIKRIIQAQCRR